MRNLILSLSLTLMLFAAGQGHAVVPPVIETAAENAEREITALERHVLQATLTSDTSVMETYYADDYVAIDGDGKLTTRTQEIENFKTGVTKYESIAALEANIRIYGDTAVVHTLATVKALVNGKPCSGDVRNTRVWVRDGGHWKLVVFQATRVEPERPGLSDGATGGPQTR